MGFGFLDITLVDIIDIFVVALIMFQVYRLTRGTNALRIVGGILIFLKPEWLWALTEQWKSYAADGPSDFYILNTKIGGVLFAVFGVVALVLPLFLT